MARLGGAEGDLGRLLVANLAHADDVRVLPQDAAQLRSVLAKVMSALGLISIWLASGSSASIGSSTVMTFRVKRSISLSMAYMVVVLPLPGSCRCRWARRSGSCRRAS